MLQAIGANVLKIKHSTHLHSIDASQLRTIVVTHVLGQLLARGQPLGKSNIDQIAQSFNIPVLARIPMQEETSRAVDAGDVDSLDIPEIAGAAEAVEKLLKK